MEQLNTLLEKAQVVNAFFKRNSHKVSVLVTVVVGTFIFMSAYDGVLIAQESDAYIDVDGSYQAASTNVEAATGDKDNNIELLDENSKTAGLITTSLAIYGTDALDAEGRQRAVALGVSDTQKSGLLGVTDQNVMALVTNPPKVDIPSHLANQWIPGYNPVSTTTVYAQEDGYDFLVNTLNLEPLWGMFRNMAYAGFVLIIMVSGFMIMFRSKLDGQVTVNLVNAIPGIVVGLIMVTFSLAIIGFVVDIGRLFTNIIASFMADLPGSYTPTDFGGPFEMAADAFGSSVWPPPGGALGGILMLSLFFTPIGPIVGIIGVLITVIVGAIAFYAAVRVYITLIMSYLKILMEVLLGPIYILLGSLPGKSSMIINWFKRALSAALTFPIIYFILNLAGYIGKSGINTGLGSVMKFMGGGEAHTPMIQVHGIFVIALYFFAAGAPGIVDELLAVVPSKGTQAAIEGAKKAMGKVPIVGGVFG